MTKNTYEVHRNNDWPRRRPDHWPAVAASSRFPEGYTNAADVEANSLRDAARPTTEVGSTVDDARSRVAWEKNEGVRVLTHGPRNTDRGDGIVNPQGQRYRVEMEGFESMNSERQELVPGAARDASDPFVDASPRPEEICYIIAVQPAERGGAWDFVAGPYDSRAMAKDNQEYATEEYANRKNHPEWFEGAEISVVRSDVRMPTALGSIRMPEMEDVPTPAELEKLAAEIRHDEGLRVMEDRGVKYEDEYQPVLDQRNLVARYDPVATIPRGEGQEKTKSRSR